MLVLNNRIKARRDFLKDWYKSKNGNKDIKIINDNNFFTIKDGNEERNFVVLFEVELEIQAKDVFKQNFYDYYLEKMKSSLSEDSFKYISENMLKSVEEAFKSSNYLDTYKKSFNIYQVEGYNKYFNENYMLNIFIKEIEE